jgi:hypothetical protein
VTFDFSPLDIIMVFDVGGMGVGASDTYLSSLTHWMDSYEFSWAVLVIKKTMLFGLLLLLTNGRSPGPVSQQAGTMVENHY